MLRRGRTLTAYHLLSVFDWALYTWPMLPDPMASASTYAPRTSPWLLPDRMRSAWNGVRMFWPTRCSARAGGSPRGAVLRNSPTTWSSRPQRPGGMGGLGGPRVALGRPPQVLRP